MLITSLTERFGLRHPILGAPMAGVAGGALASAVTAGGGLGMIGVGGATPVEWIAEQARVATPPFGIGLTAWVLDRDRAPLEAVVAAAPDLVSVSFGDPGPHLARLKDAGIATATQVGLVEEARRAVDSGADLIVARGAEGGGHGRDRIATLPLLQSVLDAVGDRVPVVAAGGIVTGRGLAAVLAAGAAGAWIGTALLACPETLHPEPARAAAIGAGSDDTVYTSVFDLAQGIPWPPEFGGRALRNEFTRAWHGREQALVDDPDASNDLATARKERDYRIAYVYAGQGVGAVTGSEPAAAVVERLGAEAEDLLRRW